MIALERFTPVVPVIVLIACAGTAVAGGEDRVHVSSASDDHAIEIAQSVVQKMGGWEHWDAARYVHWSFFGRRKHDWDRWTGDIRIETDKNLILMNINTKKGRAWEEGKEVVDPDKLAGMLESGHKMWVNDSYWMFMPYKLLDEGVTLKYTGEKDLDDGRPADVLTLSFDGVGYTPENRYEVFVAKDTGLVEAWSYFAKAGDEKAAFTLPWGNWKQFGNVMLATEHGRGVDWEIAVKESMPRTLFTEP
ncbi:MAG: hypothetical protein ACE5IK_07580 [Acidobacteriota bacterium]